MPSSSIERTGSKLAHSVSNMFNFDAVEDSQKMNILVEEAVAHQKSYDRKKLVTVSVFLMTVASVAFVGGAAIGVSSVGASQKTMAKESTAMYAANTASTTSASTEEEEDFFGGYCWSCSDNISEPRGWSWWFGWGACECKAGWKGACCDIDIAVVDGGFGDWSEYGECSSACGYGTAERTRECNNPKPLNGGQPCLGAYTQLGTCYLGPCADGGPLFGAKDLADAALKVFGGNIQFSINDFFEKGLCHILASTDKIQAAYFNSMGGQVLYERVNFLRGFKWWELGGFGDWMAGERWVAPVQDEVIPIVPYTEVTGFDYGYQFMNDFFTAANDPSWEVDDGHDMGIGMLTSMLQGGDSTCLTKEMSPRFPMDHDMLMKGAWDGFNWFDYHEIKYASNGDFGYHLAKQRAAEQGDTTDSLGLLMSETVFSVHLTYDKDTEIFHLDLTDMEPYTPIEGYAAMGGKAEFVFDNTYGKYGRLRTTKITYGGNTFGPSDFADPAVMEAEKDSRWVGWRFAEKCIMSSLLGQTNLILHVKGLHLELAAAFQGSTIDAFSSNVKHPIRRLLDQFTHRSVQATNGNFDLLFEHKAAEFSLAPLPWMEQLKMIEWYINNKPLSMASLDMVGFAKVRNMETFSEKPEYDANGRPEKFFWRWHYRALKAQNMYIDMINCWVDENYSGDWNALLTDELTIKWWSNMKTYLPSVNEAITQDPEWISNGDLTRDSITKVMSTLMTWVSHIHEDVGHSAAYVVYNPVITPMQVPADGIGVPFNSFAFNCNAYRTFVFLERAKLLEEPASFWFNDAASDKQCYTTMQDTYRGWGQTDDAFSECGETGFYSCVEQVETSVSS